MSRSSVTPSHHHRHLSHGAGSRRGSFASGSRRGSLCPRIAHDVASRLVLNALFGYINMDDEWDDPHFMLPINNEGIRATYVISDYMEAVEAVIAQLDLEIALATSMSGLDPTATSSAADLLETAQRNGIITAAEYELGSTKLMGYTEPLQLKQILRTLQQEWKKYSIELVMTPVMLQQTYQQIRGRSSTNQQTPEESQIQHIDDKHDKIPSKKYSISAKRKSSIHSGQLDTIPQETEDETKHKRSISKNDLPPPKHVQTCCVVM